MALCGDFLEILKDEDARDAAKPKRRLTAKRGARTRRRGCRSTRTSTMCSGIQVRMERGEGETRDERRARDARD
jgi:hypothetical protein